MPLRGDRLRQLRLSRGFTQEALAEKLSLGIRQIHRYERGLSDPSGNIVAKIAKELDVTTDYLLGLSDLPNNNQPSEQALTAQEQLLLTAYRRKEVALLVQIINAALDQAPDGLPGAKGDGPSTSRRRRRRSQSDPPQPQR
jgi:transcriptional regulator with XRE-family HTH domain